MLTGRPVKFLLTNKIAQGTLLTGRPVKPSYEDILSAKEKILDSADTLFGESGFDATTTREIAEKSGVNKALIHYHFKSKETLLQKVLERHYERLANTLQGPLEREGDVRSKILDLIDVYVDFLNQNLNFCKIVQRESGGGKNKDRIRDHTTPFFQAGMEMIKRAFPQTVKGDLAAQHILVSFYGMIVTYFTYSDVLEHLLGEDPLTPENLKSLKKHLNRMAEIVLREIQVSE